MLKPRIKSLLFLFFNSREEFHRLLARSITEPPKVISGIGHEEDAIGADADSDFQAVLGVASSLSERCIKEISMRLVQNLK